MGKKDSIDINYCLVSLLQIILSQEARNGTLYDDIPAVFIVNLAASLCISPKCSSPNKQARVSSEAYYCTIPIV